MKTLPKVDLDLFRMEGAESISGIAVLSQAHIWKRDF